MPPVTSDNDLPKLLNTPTKQATDAGDLQPDLLRYLADGREVVIQFRTEQLDVDAFVVAKGALDRVVPDVMALHDDELEKYGVWAYSLERLPGQVWVHGVAGKGGEGRIAINKSLGRVLPKGYLADNSGDAVATKVRPHIEAILASPLDEVATYRPLLQGLLDKLDDLGKLPLWVSHYDLNDVNVLIDESCGVTGLIDWELSTPKPFAVGLGRIHTLAGEYTGGEFWMPDEF